MKNSIPETIKYKALSIILTSGNKEYLYVGIINNLKSFASDCKVLTVYGENHLYIPLDVLPPNVAQRGGLFRTFVAEVIIGLTENSNREYKNIRYKNHGITDYITKNKRKAIGVRCDVPFELDELFPMQYGSTIYINGEYKKS